MIEKLYYSMRKLLELVLGALFISIGTASPIIAKHRTILVQSEATAAADSE
jgi:hypothetical protein